MSATSAFIRGLVLAFGSIFLLVLVVRLAPQSRLGRVLRTPMGPSLDVAEQTRSQCLRSALGFFVIGLTAFGLAWLLVYFVEPRELWDSTSFMVVFMTLGYFIGIGGIGALYLLIHAPFRPTTLEADD